MNNGKQTYHFVGSNYAKENNQHWRQSENGVIN